MIGWNRRGEGEGKRKLKEGGTYARGWKTEKLQEKGVEGESDEQRTESGKFEK